MITCKPGDVAQIEIVGHFGFSVQLQYNQNVGHCSGFFLHTNVNLTMFCKININPLLSIFL